MEPARLQSLLDKALRFDKRTLGRLVSAFEDQRPQASAFRSQVLQQLSTHPQRRSAFLVGLTGPPGVGKSSLVSALCQRLLKIRPGWHIGVLAIDPSSEITGGALLGDRTRLELNTPSQRLFFRSQASQRALGGLGRDTFAVCQLLEQLCDLVLVETVGVGQSELDVRHLVDELLLVLQPQTGDRVQFIKAGIMEVPDAFVLNKVDEHEQSDLYAHTLRASLRLFRMEAGSPPSLFRTSATTGSGLEELTAHLLGRESVHLPLHSQHRHARWFAHSIRTRWGQEGLRCLEQHLGGALPWLEQSGTQEEAEKAFVEAFREWLQNVCASVLPSVTVVTEDKVRS